MPKVAYYFMRCHDDDRIMEFCVVNAGDPEQYVETLVPDGTRQRWAKRTEGGMLVFHPPDGYTGGPVGWVYDRRLQRGEPMPRHLLERMALNMRVSVDMGGCS